jgi:hypothetical protein
MSAEIAALNARILALERRIGRAASAGGGTPTSRQIISGGGLTGGGDLSEIRWLLVLTFLALWCVGVLAFWHTTPARSRVMQTTGQPIDVLTGWPTSYSTRTATAASLTEEP